MVVRQMSRKLHPERLTFTVPAMHDLNLVLCKLSMQGSSYCLPAGNTLGVFFKYSSKRQRQLEQAIELINTERKTSPKAITTMKMKPMCETRWVEKHKCLDDFYELFEALINCMEAIATEPDWDSKAKTMPVACCFRLQVQRFCVHSAQYLIYLDIPKL